jgi:hypothetical protein
MTLKSTPRLLQGREQPAGPGRPPCQRRRADGGRDPPRRGPDPRRPPLCDAMHPAPARRPRLCAWTARAPPPFLRSRAVVVIAGHRGIHNPADRPRHMVAVCYSSASVRGRCIVNSTGMSGPGDDRLGLYPIVNSQYPSTTLYQVSYHIQ